MYSMQWLQLPLSQGETWEGEQSSNSIQQYLFYCTLCVQVLVCIYIYALLEYLVPAEARRGHQIPIELELQMVVSLLWVLKTESWSSGRAVSAPDH